MHMNMYKSHRTDHNSLWYCGKIGRAIFSFVATFITHVNLVKKVLGGGEQIQGVTLLFGAGFDIIGW